MNCPRCNQARMEQMEGMAHCLACGWSGEHLAADNSDPTFANIKPPGIFLKADLTLQVAYSGPRDDPRVHVAAKMADQSKLGLLQPAIETVMGLFAKTDPDGFEASLEKLCRGAAHSAGHMKVRKVDDGEEADSPRQEGGDSEIEGGG